VSITDRALTLISKGEIRTRSGGRRGSLNCGEHRPSIKDGQAKIEFILPLLAPRSLKAKFSEELNVDAFDTSKWTGLLLPF
jgi:hypothetical protein